MFRIQARDVSRTIHTAMEFYPNWIDLNFEELPRWHEIQFDDGSVVKSHIKQTFWCALFWRIFESYPNTRILPKHYITDIIGDGSLDSGTHLEMCSRILRSIVEEEGLFDPASKEPLLKEIYQTISDAQLALRYATCRNMSSVDYLDFLQIAKHPQIEALKQEAFKDPNKIKATYEGALKVIKTDPELYENGLAKASRCKMVKPNQVMQCVVFRGYATEVDGMIYNARPIWSNYTLGNTRLFDFAADSRTAAKSHYYSDSALKNAEYMSRKFRLFTNTVERIDWTPCDNSDWLPWTVRGPVKDASGATVYKGDLPNLVGKHYRLHGDDVVGTIEGDEKHLIGRKIFIRSVLTCKSPNPHMRCVACVGLLSQNISRFANLGHLGSITTCKPVTQNVLSIKHVNMSATALKVILDDVQRKYFNTGKSGTAFYFNESLKKMNAKMTVTMKDAPGLTEIELTDDLDSTSLSRVSSIEQVKIETEVGGVVYPVFLKLTQKLKKPVMSWEFLEFAKREGWSIDERGHFVFDLTKWDYSLPALSMPGAEESFSDLGRQVDSLVRANQSKRKERRSADAPFRLLQDMFDLLNSMLSINILSMEIIVYGLMLKNDASFELAGRSKKPVLGIADPLTVYRSISSAMLYERQMTTITNPVNYLEGYRPDSPFDVFFDPKNVVQEYQQRGYG